MEKHSVVVACGDETQQELIPFKHKERWVVELVLSELTVTEIDGVRRHDARELTATRQQDARGASEIVAYTLK